MLRGLKILGLAGAILALIAPTSEAAATRAEYVAEAEAICLSHGQALQRSASPLLTRLKRAPKRFEKALRKAKSRRDIRRAFQKVFRPVAELEIKVGNALSGMNAALTALIPPAPDATVISSWLASMRLDAANFVKFGGLMKGGAYRRADAAAEALLNHAQATDALVAGFGFKECLLAPPAGTYAQ